ncbi:heterokaryon incompatibility protein-domain-containing protein [Thelonectria olida]|uniref:Heterokaryon incompatibility protein-domain-containing protein n=1 Tax=Thelonectria olida TaxID=1576542 RepID=A0A9P8WIW2_9HYPO|nr:heterokaryon incompatibility protein-domain-containing protein [Thelonectria olida]
MSDDKSTATSIQPFVYESLPPSCIRLLERDGRTSDGRLRFNIRVSNITDSNLQYHCLSYTWGNPYANGVYSIDRFDAVDEDYAPEKQVPILVNEQVLHIQKNLYDALTTIPDNVFAEGPRGADQLVWADAICINQGDMDEKSAQVSIMDRIYSRATFVLAWLGPEDEDTETGLGTLTTLAVHVEEFQESRIVPYGGDDKENYEAASIPFISWSDWISLATIFQRQWFKRAWIVQEAILPGTLLMYCGKHKVAWRELGPVAEALRRNEAKLGTSRSKKFVPENQIAVPVEWNMAEIYKYRTFMNAAMGSDTGKASRYKDVFTLEELIHCFWTFLATDPRDKIFSLHGILNVFAEKRLESDYRKSIESVYTGAARQIILEARNLGLLSSCIVSQERRQGLPSWVPDFGLPGVNAIPNLFSADKGLEYHALKGDLLDEPVLRVRGFRRGAINLVGNRQATNPGEKFRFDASWLKMALSLKMDEKGGGRRLVSEVLWRTLCMDMSYGSFFDAEKFGPRAPDEFNRQFKIFMMVMILAVGDAQVLQHFGIDKSPYDRNLTVISEPYNPFDQDLASVLDDLDALSARDGEECCTPTREEVVVLWDSLRYTVSRLTRANTDGSPVDIYLPPDVTQGRARVVGSGLVETGSTLFGACLSFATAYNVAYGGRQLFTLGAQHLGLGPLSSRVGDEVWILPGLSTPAVLRRVVGEDTGAKSVDERVVLDDVCRYHFVGAAYVHGIMHSEAVEARVHADLEEVELV